jgi:hypothetical protein
MCFDPISLSLLAASTAASVGGGMIENNEAQRNMNAQADARNQVLDAFLKKQSGYQDQNTATFNKQADTMTADENAKSQTAAVDNRNQAIDRATGGQPASAEAIPLSGSAPSIVKQEIAKRVGDAFAAATDNVKKQAKAASYGDVFQKNNIGIQQAGNDIGTTNTFARDDAALLPARQDLAATAAYKAPSGWGTVLKGLGTVGSLAAGSGMFAPGAAGAKGIGNLFSMFGPSGGSAFPVSSVTGRIAGPL